MSDDECSIFLPKRCLQQKFMDCPLKPIQCYSLLIHLCLFKKMFFSFAREEPSLLVDRVSRFLLFLGKPENATGESVNPFNPL